MYNLEGKSVKQLSDGGFIITGSFDRDTTDAFDMDIYVLRTDPSGEIIWSKAYPITVGDREEKGNSISVIGESGYIIAGHKYAGVNHRDLYIMRINLAGDTLWTRTYGKRNLESAECIEPVSDGGFIIAGYTTLIGDQYSKIYLLRLEKESTGIKKTYNGTLLMGNSLWNIKRIEIYDLLGRKIKTLPANADFNLKEVNGIYIVRLVGKDIKKQFKVMLTK